MELKCDGFDKAFRWDVLGRAVDVVGGKMRKAIRNCVCDMDSDLKVWATLDVDDVAGRTNIYLRCVLDGEHLNMKVSFASRYTPMSHQQAATLAGQLSRIFQDEYNYLLCEIEEARGRITFSGGDGI